MKLFYQEHSFEIQGYDTIRNDRSTGARGGVAFLVKHGLVINKEYRNIDFNIITDNEALVIDIDLSNNQNLFWLSFTVQMEIRTLGCLKPSTTFLTMSCLSANSILSWKLSTVPRKTSAGPLLKNIPSHLNITYLNNDEHMHLDKRTSNTYISDMTFISPNLTKHDIQFLIGDNNLGSDHLSIEIPIDAQPHRKIDSNLIKYKFDQTDREVLESTLETALT